MSLTNSTNPLDINSKQEATIAASDEVIFADASDSFQLKKDTVQGILDLAGGGGGSSTELIYYNASDLDLIESSVPTLTTLTGSSVVTRVLAFDDVNEDRANGKFRVPDNIDTSGTVNIYFKVIAEVAEEKDAVMNWEGVARADGEDYDATLVTKTETISFTSTQDQIHEGVISDTVANFGWAAGDDVFWYISRTPSSPNDSLIDSVYLFGVAIEIPLS